MHFFLSLVFFIKARREIVPFHHPTLRRCYGFMCFLSKWRPVHELQWHNDTLHLRREIARPPLPLPLPPAQPSLQFNWCLLADCMIDWQVRSGIRQRRHGANRTVNQDIHPGRASGWQLHAHTHTHTHTHTLQTAEHIHKVRFSFAKVSTWTAESEMVIF